MDRTDLSDLVTSVTRFLDLSLIAVKVLKDNQGFNNPSIEDTLTDINASLLFTRDILEREDDAAETSTFEEPLIHSLEQSLVHLQSDLKKFSASILESNSRRQRWRAVFRLPTGQPKQNHERIQQSSEKLRALLKRLDSLNRSTIKDIDVEAPVKKEAKGHDILFRKRPARVTFDFVEQQNQYQFHHLQAREGSKAWLLQHQAFEDWLKEPGMVLWLDGPGNCSS